MEFLASLEHLLYILVPATLVYSAPLIAAALGGVFSERAGVTNLALEGIMVMGAFSAIVFNLTFAEQLGGLTPWVGLLVGMLVGALFSSLHALASITFRAEQIVSGVALNMLALGFSVYMIKMLYGKGQTDTISEPFHKASAEILSQIPVIGTIFFSDFYWIAYITIALAFVAWFVLFKTPFGLRLRAVGEHPMAADTMGINVAKMRYTAVIMSGALAGLGGAIFAQTITLDFSVTTIAGQGFMAMAAMIFGKWHPVGAMVAALFFGLSQALGVVGSFIPLLENVPNFYLLILPYVLTILALAGFIGRADAPAAIGQPYIKGKR